MSIHSKLLTQVAYLVRETDLCRMKGIAGILDHFSFANGRAFDGSVDLFIYLNDAIGRPVIVGADDGEWRSRKIVHGSCFTNEFRVHTNAKIDSRALI